MKWTQIQQSSCVVLPDQSSAGPLMDIMSKVFFLSLAGDECIQRTRDLCRKTTRTRLQAVVPAAVNQSRQEWSQRQIYSSGHECAGSCFCS